MIVTRALLTATVGKIEETTAGMVAARDAAVAATGLTWSAWAGLAGTPYGSFALSARTESMAQMTEATLALGDDATWQKISTQFGGLITGPADVAVDEIIHVAGSPEGAQPFAFVADAQLAPGQASAGYAWSVKVLEFVHQVTGVPGQLATSVAGPMFKVSWLSSVNTMAEFDDFNAALAVDPGYFTLLDEAAGLFVDGPAHRSIAMRLP